MTLKTSNREFNVIFDSFNSHASDVMSVSTECAAALLSFRIQSHLYPPCCHHIGKREDPGGEVGFNGNGGPAEVLNSRSVPTGHEEQFKITMNI